jgi:hypothetical protein
VKESIVLNVEANVATFTASTYPSVQKIYLAGRSIMMDVVLENTGTEPMRKAPKLKFGLKLADQGAYTDLGVKSGRVRRSIAAGATGIATYKVGKANPRTISLIGAEATCEVPLP